MDTHIVTRKFAGPGSIVLTAGMRIDASNWKNLDPLVDTNYLRPLNVNEIAPAKHRGRKPGSKNKPKESPSN